MTDRCQARVLVKDDRFDVVDRCDGTDGHFGPHVSDRSACEPRAWLSWIGSYEAEYPPLSTLDRDGD